MSSLPKSKRALAAEAAGVGEAWEEGLGRVEAQRGSLRCRVDTLLLEGWQLGVGFQGAEGRSA